MTCVATDERVRVAGASRPHSIGALAA